MLFCHRIIADAEIDVGYIYFRARFQCVKTPGENALEKTYLRGIINCFETPTRRDSAKTLLLTGPVVQFFTCHVKIVTVSTTKTNKKPGPI